MLQILPFSSSDYPIIKNIYQSGIDTKNATFETLAPEWEKFDKKFLTDFRLKALIENQLVAWAALSRVSTRKVYSGVCEVSVYVDQAFSNKGIGTQLLQQLIQISEIQGIWTLQASIFPENKASLRIHKNLGFRKIGYREKIAKMDEVWRDTILLERRSKLVL